MNSVLSRNIQKFLVLWIFVIAPMDAAFKLELGFGSLRLVYLLVFFLSSLFIYQNGQVFFFQILKFLKQQKTLIVIILFSLISALINNLKSGLVWNLWMLFNILSIFIISRTLNHFSVKKIEKVLPFVIVLNLLPAIIQKIAIVLGFSPPLVTQTHNYVPRLNGLSMYANFYGVYLSLFIPFLIFSNIKIFLKFILLSLLMIFVFDSTSRVGWGNSIFVLGCSLLFLLIKKRKNDLIMLLVSLCLLICYIVFVPSSTLIPPITDVESSAPDSIGAQELRNLRQMSTFEIFIRDISNSSSSLIERAGIAIQGINVYKSSPILGVGPRNYENFIKSKGEEYRNEIRPAISTTMDTHYHHENIWIELLVENGIIPLFLFVFYFLRLMYSKVINFSTLNFLQRGALIGLFSYLFVAGMFLQNINNLLIYLLVGLLVANFQECSDKEPSH